MAKHNKGYARIDRVQEQVMRELADLVRTQLKDPRAGFVTINAVEVTKDYSHAKVFYTVLDQETVASTQIALEHAAGFLRSELARRITVFNTPKLHFIYDESLERGMNLSRLIDEVCKDYTPDDEHTDDDNQ